MSSAQQGDFLNSSPKRPGINSAPFAKSYLNVSSTPTTIGTTLVFIFHTICWELHNQAHGILPNE